MPSSSPATPRRVWDVVLDVLVVTAALLGAAVSLSGTAWGGLCVIAALVGLSAQLVQTRLERNLGWSPLGRSLVLRTIAVVAAAIGLGEVAESRGAVLAAALGAAVLVGSIVVEPFVARATRFTVPVASGLPGLPTRRGLRDLGVPAVAASLLATATGVVLAMLGLSAWWWVPAALVAVSPVVALAVDGRAKIVFARARRAALPGAMREYAPDFLLYTSRPDDASYQVTMWLPYLERAGLRFVIVTRNAVPAAALASLTDVPVVEARGISDLDGLVVGSLKAAFYVNASSGNGSLVRFQHLTHVYLGHGDSDKPPSYNPTHAMYDVIFAAGPAAARRYAAHGVRIPADKFTIVGRPQVEDVHPAAGPIGSVQQPTVLYAPTWRGHVEETMLYSLPSGERIVSALLARGSTVIFRPHPFSYEFAEDAAAIARIHQLLDADRRRTGRAHRWGHAAERELGILDCINASDAMVSDVSSVVSDYLFSGKPFTMIAVPLDPEAFVAEFPVARASYVVRGDLADLEGQLAAMLGPDPLAAQREAIRVDYLGDFPAEEYADAFVDAVRQVSSKETVDLGHEQDEQDEQEESGDTAAADEEPADEAADGRAGRDWSRYGRVLFRVGLDLGGTALALGGLAVAMVDGPDWAVTLLAAAAVWATFQSASANVRARTRWPRLLTEGDATRTTLVGALLVQRAHHGLSGGDLVATGLLVAAVVVERRIRPAWTSGAVSLNLAGAEPLSSELVPRGALPLIGAGATVAGCALTWAGAPDWSVLIVAAVVAAAAAEITVRALRHAAQVDTAEVALRPALVRHAPRFAVYFASTVGAHYQIGMWLDYFVRIDRPFVIVTRTAAMLRQAQQLCLEAGVAVPILHRPTLRSVEDVIVDTMTAAFYVNNAPRNTHLIERRELTHVWLNHGDSEKPACYNPVHAIYDLIFAAGQAGIDRYARHGVDIPREKFRIVGRPQVELITPARGPVAELADRTVLYAPTWQGPFADSRVYSLPSGRQIVEQLVARGARVVFRAHPFNYRYPDAQRLIAEIGELLDRDRAASGRQHLWGPAAEQELTVEDCFNASDAMVSDVSAVVSDYLHSDKPFAMVSVGRTPEQLVRDAPAARAAYVIRDDLSNLAEVLDLLLGLDPLAEVRRETKVYYLGDFPDASYAEGFLTAAREVIDAGRLR